MSERLIIAGFGGQGILTAGKLLCSSCLEEGKNVTYLPSYGSEVRGGTANCHVVISESEIFSPAVDNADSMVILNDLSLVRFCDNIKKGGLLLANSSIIDLNAHDIKTADVFPINATNLASELGSPIVANIIMLGALITIRKVCGLKTAEESIRNFLIEKNKTNNLNLNLRALDLGRQLAADEGRA